VAGLLGPAGPALGVLPAASFPESDLYLPPGAAFCAYTDGLIDRHSEPESAGSRRLARVASQVFGRLSGGDSNRAPVSRLLAEDIVRRMLDGAILDDDVCVAVLSADTEGA
jgi:hypothetical protein